MFPYICEFHLYFEKKKNEKKNAVIPTYPIVFPKKIRRRIKSFSYLPTLFDFSMLAETNLFFFLALWKICVFDSFGRSLNRVVKNT